MALTSTTRPGMGLGSESYFIKSAAKVFEAIKQLILHNNYAMEMQTGRNIFSLDFSKSYKTSWPRIFRKGD